MSLYGRTDSNANKAKAGIGIAASAQAKQTIFIDDTEAALAENKARGLNAPGWWSYYTFTDCDGNTRHKAEMLVTIAGPEANADETQSDDSVAADVSVVITINTQPADTAVAVDASFCVFDLYEILGAKRCPRLTRARASLTGVHDRPAWRTAAACWP
mgnify:CR=1 FL=1